MRRFTVFMAGFALASVMMVGSASPSFAQTEEMEVPGPPETITPGPPETITVGLPETITVGLPETITVGLPETITVTLPETPTPELPEPPDLTEPMPDLPGPLLKIAELFMPMPALPTG